MQTRKALKSLSNGEIQYDRVTPGGPLAQNASWLLESHARRIASVQEAQGRHQIASSMPVLEAAKQKLMQIIGERVLPDDTPIAMRFDVFNVIKQSSKKNPKDVGLKRFATHLERLWHEEPIGTISAGALTRLRDHYQSTNLRSFIGEAVDTLVPKVAFNNLPVAQFTRIAAEIDTQEDYNVAMMRHGLHRDDIRSIRARAFIRELVNRKSDAMEAGQEMIDQGARVGGVRRARVGEAAERVMNRLTKEAQSTNTDMDADADSDTDAVKDPEKEGMGVDGTGVLPMAACLKEQEEMFRWAATTGAGIPKEAVAPPGWEKTVKEMKGKEEIEEPFALAWWMKGKGYTPGGKEEKEKKAQTPYGQPWSEENLVELANDVVSEMSNPEVATLANRVVQNFAKTQQMEPPQPGSKEFSELLAYGLQSDPGTTNDLKKIMYKSMIQETEEEMVAQPPSSTPSMVQQEPALVPATAAKKEEKKNKGGPSQPEFEPEINQQQPSQEPIKPGDGLKVLKAFAVPAGHPLVDDEQNHFPVFTEDHAKAAFIYLGVMEKAPSWWLGSTQELMNTVQAAFIQKEAGDIPPEFVKNIKKKEEGSEKKEKGEKKENPFGKASERGFSAEEVEKQLTSGQVVKFHNFALRIADNKDHNILQLDTKEGYRQYQLYDMNAAISDFMYLVGTEKVTDPPAPMFLIREGIRLPCPGCSSTNSYEMPKEAMDLACDGCHTLFPSNVVEAAFKAGAAREETTLVAFTPLPLQEEFGDKFAKAAEMMEADSVGVDGCRAEAYAVSPSNEKMAEIWDYLIEAGFQSIAQGAMPPPPAAPSGGAEMVAQGPEPGMPPLDINDLPGKEGPPMGEELPPLGEEMPFDVPDIGDPDGEAGYADHQMVQAAMMHYQAQGNSVTEAVTQFTKDYGDSYDPETVMQIVATVYGIGLDQIKVGMAREAGDLPSTSVNTQQSDAVGVGKGDAVLGPDSDTKGEIPTEKGKVQSKPQGQFADTSTEEDSDNKDPGDYGAGKPKAQHPATDQQGVSLPETGLGQDSETEMGKTMKDMESKSKTAPQSTQSK